MTEELFEQICEEIASGVTLSKILLRDQMPSYAVFLVFRKATPEREKRYKEAREDQMHRWSDDIVDMSDNPTAEEGINKLKLRIESRKWLMERVGWRTYGMKTKTEHTGENGGAILFGVDAPPTETREQWLERKRREIDEGRLESTTGTAG